MLRVMIKRWYVSVPALLMAIALPVVAWFAVPAKYSSTSTISLLNSQAASSGTGRTGNPFTAFDNSLTGLADYLARTLNSDQSMADLATKHGVTDLAAAELAPNASGPFITLTITGKDPVKILAEMQTFDQFAIDQLSAIQTTTTDALKAPLPANVLVRAIVMVAPQKPITSMKSKLEDVAGAGVGGMVVLFVAVFGSEALAIRRGKPATAPSRKGEPASKSSATSSTTLRRRSSSSAEATAGGKAEAAPAEDSSFFAESSAASASGASGSSTASAAGRSESKGSLARRASTAPTPTPLETTIALPRYREPDLEAEDEPEAEPWIDIEPVPLGSFEDFAVGDREPGPR
ncbi:hypothetical protein GCM10009838_69600 [Catenulispora subtropica]|uniref:Lipopolysaccharide biosynthesis protein n=2 Tax=Catenulispora subtropica TaxID=450798 RepID=A0ABP5EEB7_9ACTN